MKRTEIVKFTVISISKRRWKRHLPNFNMVDYGYNNIEKWIDLSSTLKQGTDACSRTKTETCDIHSNPKNWIVSDIKGK